MSDLSYLKYFFLLGAFFLVLITLTSIAIRITYIRDGEDDELIVIVSGLFGLVNVKREINLIELIMSAKPGVRMEYEIEATKKGKLIKEGSSFLSYKEAVWGFQRALRLYRKFKKAFDFIRKRTAVKELSWETSLGTGDAAVTGMAVGLMWVFKTAVISILNTRLRKLRLGTVEVTPGFDCVKFRTKFDCILRFKIGHAIIASIIIISAIIKDGDTYERASD